MRRMIKKVFGILLVISAVVFFTVLLLGIKVSSGVGVFLLVVGFVLIFLLDDGT